MLIRPAELNEAEAIADIYISSFKKALPTVKLAHQDQEIRQWFKEVVLPKGGTWVAEDNSQLIGFMTIEGDVLDELYLTPEAQGHGVGSALLEKAKQIYPNGLKTYTFQVNTTARNFYEKHGFKAIRFTDGERNEEHEPDILYIWKPTVKS